MGSYMYIARRSRGLKALFYSEKKKHFLLVDGSINTFFADLMSNYGAAV